MIVFVSVSMASLFGTVVLASWASNTGLIALGHFVPFVLMASLALHGLRGPMQRERNLDMQLASFDCQNANCFLESDRAFVNSSIREWHGSLDKFNMLVRSELREKMQLTVLRKRFTYLAGFAAMSPLLGVFANFAAGYIRGNVPAVKVVSYLLHTVGVAMLLAPAFLYFLFYLADRLRPKSWKITELAETLGFGIVWALLLAICWFAWLFASKLHIAGNAIFALLFGAITWYCFFRQPGHKTSARHGSKWTSQVEAMDGPRVELDGQDGQH